jgi:hypothetical protein
MTDDEARAIAARLKPQDRRDLGSAVEMALRLLKDFAGEGLCMGPREDQDPAFVMLDISAAIGVDDWDNVPSIVRAALAEMEGRDA